MNKVKEVIGQNIKRWREFKGVKQETLATELGLSNAALSHIENGKTDVTITRIDQIAEILEITILQLLSTPQEVMETNNNNNVALRGDAEKNGQDSPVCDEVLKMLKEELSEKNKQLDQLTLSIAKLK